MNVEAAQRAFKRPHVKRAFNQLVNAIRENAAQSAYLGIVHLSNTANSDRLKFDTRKWIAGVDGISPVQKVEGRHHHNVQFGGFDYGEEEPIDVTPEDEENQ
ncbi:hypothetical protein [Ruegeria lacuscaerulensis]|uniref:hypothetical protein n=1 Tax=Ruegeria lacuscaerulensis TaxID=55218 RepID=UPI00147E5696|nr:hypothetical protein [Ruegeria lacuscaerulensis]